MDEKGKKRERQDSKREEEEEHNKNDDDCKDEEINIKIIEYKSRDRQTEKLQMDVKESIKGTDWEENDTDG
jgi:hypothetical protein